MTCGGYSIAWFSARGADAVAGMWMQGHVDMGISNGKIWQYIKALSVETDRCVFYDMGIWGSILFETAGIFG